MHDTPLAGALWRAEGPTRAVRAALLVAVGICLMTAGAKVQVPFWPVPMTLQTLAVYLIGLGYGAGLAGVTVGAYLAAGAAGLPVFAGPAAGPAYLLGPTGGFLAGFLLAAVLLGWLAERGFGRTAWTALPALLLAAAALYLPGLLWLDAAFLQDFGRTLAAGLVPFIPGEVLKILAAAFFLPIAWKLLARE